MKCDFIAGDFNSWSDIVVALDECGGVITCTMQALRDIDGHGRLGSSVREGIAAKLSSLGVGTIRPELPVNASEQVILIRQGTPVSELIEDIRNTIDGVGSLADTASSLRKLNMPHDLSAIRKAVAGAMRALDEAAQETGVEV